MSFVAQNFSDGVSTAYAHQRAIANHYRLKGFPSVTDAVKVQMYMRGNTLLNKQLQGKVGSSSTACSAYDYSNFGQNARFVKRSKGIEFML